MADLNLIIADKRKKNEKGVRDEDGNWTEIDVDTLANMFGSYVLYNQEEFENQLKVDDFNYDVFDEDYYATKFPHFDESVHEILANVSREKIIDLRNEKQWFVDRAKAESTPIEDQRFKPFASEKAEE